MARQPSKSDLPRKTCLVCGLPFTWRKKWANCWNEVQYCSERCRRRRSHVHARVKGQSAKDAGDGTSDQA